MKIPLVLSCLICLILLKIEFLKISVLSEEDKDRDRDRMDGPAPHS